MTTTCDESCGCGGGIPHEEVLRELGRFSMAWKLESVLPPVSRQGLSRAAVGRMIAARAGVDAAFRVELLSHPRWVYMVAMGEAFRVSKVAFLRQVREVRVLEESAEILYLVLPIAAELEARFLWGDGSAAAETAVETNGSGPRDEIERRLLAGAADEGEGEGRQSLLFEPLDSYLAAAREVTGGPLPAYLRSIREVRVLPETPSSLALVIPPAQTSRTT